MSFLTAPGLVLQRNCWTVAGFLATCLITTSGHTQNATPDYNPARPHHVEGGFKNNYIGSVQKDFGALLRWQRERIAAGLPKPPSQPTPGRLPDHAAIARYAGAYALAIPAQAPSPSGPAVAPLPSVTWIGHASLLVQSGGLNVLTDPIFSDRASPVSLIGPKRAQAPGLAISELPPIDVVVISHNHYDHLDRASVLQLAQRSEAAGKPILFLVPLGVKAWFTSAGIGNVIELDWWDRHTVGGVDFYLTPLQHWSARGFGDRSQTLWGGYAVFAPDFHWYFGGDTGYSKDFADTQARFADRQTARQGGGFDLALLPVGGYEPRWFMGDQHVDPAQAVQIHRDLQAKRSIGMHWGTFELTDEPLDQPPADLAIAVRVQGLQSDEFTLMAIGETRVFPARRLP